MIFRDDGSLDARIVKVKDLGEEDDLASGCK